MSIEKYGVADVAAQQRAELEQVEGKIASLEPELTKTSAETEKLSELEELISRKRALQEALADQ